MQHWRTLRVLEGSGSRAMLPKCSPLQPWIPPQAHLVSWGNAVRREPVHTFQRPRARRHLSTRSQPEIPPQSDPRNDNPTEIAYLHCVLSSSSGRINIEVGELLEHLMRGIWTQSQFTFSMAQKRTHVSGTFNAGGHIELCVREPG